MTIDKLSEFCQLARYKENRLNISVRSKIRVWEKVKRAAQLLDATNVEEIAKGKITKWQKSSQM